MYDVSIKEFFYICGAGAVLRINLPIIQKCCRPILTKLIRGRGDVNVTFDFVSGPDRDIRIREVLTEYLGPTARPTE